jgi:hypothetical protein
MVLEYFTIPQLRMPTSMQFSIYVEDGDSPIFQPPNTGAYVE